MNIILIIHIADENIYDKIGHGAFLILILPSYKQGEILKQSWFLYRSIWQLYFFRPPHTTTHFNVDVWLIPMHNTVISYFCFHAPSRVQHDKTDERATWWLENHCSLVYVSYFRMCGENISVDWKWESWMRIFWKYLKTFQATHWSVLNICSIDHGFAWNIFKRLMLWRSQVLHPYAVYLYRSEVITTFSF